MRPSALRLAAAALAAAAAAGRLGAQTLDPRAYAANPTGASCALASYAYQTGDVVFDPTVPITDVNAKLNAGAVAYVRTFGLFGRSANAGVVVPYVWGSLEGNVFEERRRITRSGFADLQMRFSTNILGSPALTPAEFARHPPKTTLGFSLRDDVNATFVPSGEIAGAEFVESLNVSRRIPPLSTSSRCRSLCSASSSSSSLPGVIRVCAKTTWVASGERSAATTNRKRNRSSRAIGRVMGISSCSRKGAVGAETTTS